MTSGAIKQLCIGTVIAASAMTMSIAGSVDPDAIFKDAQSMGAKSQGDIFTNVKSGGAVSSLPSYTPGYTGGTNYEKDPAAAYAAQKAKCVSDPKDPTCSALKTGTDPKTPTFVKLSDPALSGMATEKAPEKILGSFADTYNACTTSTPTLATPATYEDTSCRLDFGSWLPGYCTKTLQVLPQDKYSCIPGTWFATATTVRGGADTMKVEVLCEPTRKDGMHHFRVSAWGGRGACIGPQEVDINMTVPTPGAWDHKITALAPHWGGGCVPLDVYEVGTGCASGACNKDFHFVWPGREEHWVHLSYVEPRLTANAGDTIISTCGGFEADTHVGIPPDGDPSTVTTGNIPFKTLMISGRQCIRTSSTCVDGPSTKIIDGIAVYKSCWQYANQFACGELQPTSTCTEPKYQACLQTGPLACSSPAPGGNCNIADVPIQCPSGDATYSAAVNCGPASYCAGGTCYDSSSAPNTEFAKSFTYLNAAAEAAKDFDVTSQKVFTGTALKCKNKLASLIDCCDNKTMLDAIGFGGPLLLACGVDKVQLAQLQSKRSQGMCHENWSWDSDTGLLGIVLERSTSYCCFNSKLARIIVEQGRAQLGISWVGPGSDPNAPNCSGFTVGQLQMLDFSAMDLSEVFADIKVTLPSPAADISKSTSSVPNCYYGAGNCQ